MFINFWYPAAQSSELTDTPLKRRMLGQDFVLWRDSEGNAHCVSNTCTHRGGSLGDGKVKGDCIQCPYHGWQFDGDGNCTAIPSLGPKPKIPGRTRIDAYPVTERYGLIFCFLGDLPEDERPPIMEVKEWGWDGWADTIQPYEFNFNFQRSMENGIDPAHNEFVHDTHGFMGEREEYATPEVNLEETDWGTGFGVWMEAPPLPDGRMQRESGRNEGGSMWVGTGHEGAASLWTYIHPAENFHIHQYLFESPVDENHTRVWLINMRNFLPESEHDDRIMKRNEYVVLQDRDVLEKLHPVQTPETNDKEFFMPADLCIGRYRQRLKEWEKRGWRIDINTVRANEKRVAYAIPSPARREKQGWVLEPVPLIADDEQTTELDKVAGI